MSPQQPNILLIMTDQQAPGMMSCTGTPWLHTPAIDGLAAHGVRFEHAVCANPVCVPSRMSMATGMMPGRLGAVDNASGTAAVLPEAVVKRSLGMLMRKAGYATFYGGKVHMCPQLHPEAAGYDRYHRNERKTLADACIDFMTTERSEPYFAVASFINPHDICYVHNAKVERDPRLDHVTALYDQARTLPDELLPPLPANFAVPDVEPAGMRSRTNSTAVTPSGTMFETYTERDWRIYRWVYARLTEAVDGQVGRILSRIDDTPGERQTVVFFVSDHGNMHANHGLASKGVFYEESVRVPFIVADPDSPYPGRLDTTTLVNTGLDILPTCCDYAGSPFPAELLGRSVRPAVQKSAEATREGANGGAAASHRYVCSENDHGRMIRTTRFKYTVYAGDEPREILTDLEDDPGEVRNLALSNSHRELLAEYRRLMGEWYQVSGDETGARTFDVA
jgi:arylsulfatase A-like enzyme